MSAAKQTQQLTTFYLGRDLYGIEVMRVQEVTGNTQVMNVPLAPDFVAGLVNLRGQIATALELRKLFGIAGEPTEDRMSVVAKIDGSLFSLLVDTIGDVAEVSTSQFERPPETVPAGVRRFLKGIYKLDGALLSIIDLEKLSQELSKSLEPIESISKS